MNAFEHMRYLQEHGHHLYQVNDDLAYIYEPLTEENSFLKKEKDTEPLPTYKESRDTLPALIWEGHSDVVHSFDRAWEIAFSNLRTPTPDDSMVSNYIDTAFNGFLFLWDSSFITMFGRYGARVFNFQKTLDNFYARQHMDGFICREIAEKVKGDQFHRFDPCSTGPNILAWAEWESFGITGDKERLAAVFAPLVAYHRWLRRYRTWPDGTYWTTGWGCGMDNQPRVMPGHSPEFSHGGQVWADACIQQILSCKTLMKMASILGRESEVEDMREEAEYLTKTVNEKLWDEETAFYYDLWPNGKKSMVKSIGAYWALLAEIVPEEKLPRFIAHLENENEFNRPHRIPALSADHPDYCADGGYWRGGVWPPTNYMVLKGLDRYGYYKLANEIARSHVANVAEVCAKTDTLWENYAPESTAPGNPAKPDLVGWSGLPPIAVTIEQLFGIRSDAVNRRITWRINCTERHGVERYPLCGGAIDLICPAHAEGEKPEILWKTTVPAFLTVIWPDGEQMEYTLIP